MKNCLMVVAVMAVAGLSVPGHAAQPEQKAGKDRVRMEYGAVARPCDGLQGDARVTCLKEARVAGGGGRGRSDARPGKRDEKK